MKHSSLFTYTLLIVVGIGYVFFLHLYFQDRTEKFPDQIKINSSKDANVRLDESKSNIPIQTDKICTDRIRLAIWHDLKRDKKFKNKQHILADTNNCLEKMFKVEKFDLDNDGTDEFLVRGDDINFCGATANCDFWIYKKFSNSYHRLLSGISYLDGRDIFSQVKRHKTNKYKDLILEVYVDRNAHAYRIYKFNGKKYKEKECKIHVWSESNSSSKTQIMSCKQFEKKNYKLNFLG